MKKSLWALITGHEDDKKDYTHKLQAFIKSLAVSRIATVVSFLQWQAAVLYMNTTRHAH